MSGLWILNLGASPQLEYWNNGMMEHWVLGNWDIGPLEKFPIDMGENISKNENFPLKTTFQHSNIPCARHKHQAPKNPFNFSKLYKFRDV